MILSALGQTLFRLEQDDRALSEFHKALELDNALEHAHLGLANVYERRGNHADAISEYRLAVQHAPRSGRARAALGYALAQAGDTGEAKQILSELITALQERYVSPVHLAIISAGLGDKEAALNWIEQAYDRGDPTLCDVMIQLRFQGLYTHPRFRAVLQRMGLAAYQSVRPVD